MLGEAGLGQGPGHRRRTGDDQHDRARERRALAEYRIDALEVELAVHEEPDQDAIDDADRADFGRGGDSTEDEAADYQRQSEAGQRYSEIAKDASPTGSFGEFGVVATRSPDGHDQENRGGDRGRQETGGKQGGDGDAHDRADDDQH